MDIREKIAKELYVTLTGLNWPPDGDDRHVQATLKFADKILALPEIKEGLKLRQRTNEPGWWCDHCQKSVDGVFVTFDETHTECGHKVI